MKVVGMIPTTLMRLWRKKFIPLIETDSKTEMNKKSCIVSWRIEKRLDEIDNGLKSIHEDGRIHFGKFKSFAGTDKIKRFKLMLKFSGNMTGTVVDHPKIPLTHEKIITRL